MLPGQLRLRAVLQQAERQLALLMRVQSTAAAHLATALAATRRPQKQQPEAALEPPTPVVPRPQFR